jgi:hypothetical protein
LVRLQEPSAGVGLFGVFTWGDRVIISIALYLFGRDAAKVAVRDEPSWRAWIEQAPFTLRRHEVAP